MVPAQVVVQSTRLLAATCHRKEVPWPLYTQSLLL